MGRFLAVRLLTLVGTVFVVSTFAFLALEIAPGDPLQGQLSDQVIASLSADQLEQRRADMGLTGPVWERYLNWAFRLFQGDWGYSVITGRPVLDEIATRLVPTVVLMGTSLVLAFAIGIPLGVLAARRQNSRMDHLLTGLSLTIISTPSFIFGLLMIYFLALKLGVLPAGGLETVGGSGTLSDRFLHLVTPAFVLGTIYGAQVLRYVRAGMLDSLQQDYMITARAKGLPERLLLWRHALRNALIPIVTLVGLLIPYMVAGAVVTEQVFGWPGMGQLIVAAAIQQDPALLTGIMLVLAIGVVLGNAIADLAYSAADPRIRVLGKAGA